MVQYLHFRILKFPLIIIDPLYLDRLDRGSYRSSLRFQWLPLSMFFSLYLQLSSPQHGGAVRPRISLTTIPRLLFFQSNFTPKPPGAMFLPLQFQVLNHMNNNKSRNPKKRKHLVQKHLKTNEQFTVLVPTHLSPWQRRSAAPVFLKATFTWRGRLSFSVRVSGSLPFNFSSIPGRCRDAPGFSATDRDFT